MALSPADAPIRYEVDGLAVEVALHYDRNDAAVLEPFGDRFLQLGPAGVPVLRGPLLEPRGALALSSPVTAVGRDGVDALLGGQDGTVWRLVAGSEPAPIGHVRGAVLWVGRVAGGLHVLAHDDRRLRLGPIDRGRDTVIPLDRQGPTRRPPRAVHAQDGVLWLGFSHGEWGGDVAWVRPGDARLHVLPGADPDERTYRGQGALPSVLGFSEVGGELWAWGGDVSGLTHGEAWIGRVTPRAVETLHHAWGGSEPAAAPAVAVHEVAQDADGLVLFSGRDVWRADPGLAAWRQIGTLRSLPEPLEALGERPPGVVMSADENLFHVAGDEIVRVREPDRLTVTYARLVSTPEGLFAYGYGGAEIRMPTGWKTVGRQGHWVATDEALWQILSPSVIFPGEESGRGVATWRRATAEGLQEELRAPQNSRWGDEMVGLPRGRWVTVDDEHLWELRDGAYVDRGPAPFDREPRWVPGTPDILLHDDGALARLPVEGPLEVLGRATAAVGFPEGRLLVARPSGRVAWLEDGAWERAAWDVPGEVRAMAVDGCGRVWFAGDGLYVADGDRLRDLGTGPGLSGRRWGAAAPLADGVAVSDGVLVAEIAITCR